MGDAHIEVEPVVVDLLRLEVEVRVVVGEGHHLRGGRELSRRQPAGLADEAGRTQTLARRGALAPVEARTVGQCSRQQHGQRQ